MNFISHIKAYYQKPQNIILVVFSILLIFLTVFPLFSLVRDSFVVHASELAAVKGAKPGDFTLFHWRKIFFDGVKSANIFYKPLLNSMIISIGSCLVALLMGGFVAWLITRTNIKYKAWISGMFILPYIMPSWTLALAWRNFFRNEYAGGAIGLFTAMTGINAPNWLAYGAFPIMMTLGIHYAPFAYILIGGALRTMDSNLEEAAQLLHASRAKILFRITFPITLPAILSTVLLVFSSSFGSYAVPVFLGAPVRYQVLTTQLSSKLSGTSPGYGYVMSLVMIAIGVLILGINQKFIGSRKSYTTISGKSGNFSLFNWKKWRNVVSIFGIIFVLIITIFPLLTFALESFMTHTGVYQWSNLTTAFWFGKGERNIANSEPGIFRNVMVWSAFGNSIRLSTIVALVTGTVGMLCGYAIAKTRGSKLSGFLNNLAFFPYLMPALAFGAIYLSMFSKRNFFIPSLYGTMGILILAGAVKYLPFASRTGVNAMLQIGNEIEEAAIVMGIPWWKRMTRIIFPIQKSSYISGFLLPFISSMRELSLYVLLCTPKNRVLTTLLYAYNERGIEQYANAVNLMIVIFVVVVNLMVNRITGASIDKGIGE